MSRPRTFLLEVGCEEIPAGTLPPALEDLRAGLLERLTNDSGLGGECETPAVFGGPRRLVAIISGIRSGEEDRVELITGPAVSASYGADGRPTRAAIGFAKAQAVAVEQLERIETRKGVVVGVRRSVPGRAASEVLARACPDVLGAMRFPKMMKWGRQGHRFVRPVRWILALLDEEIVDFEFLGVRSGRLTYGHRFL
ncbi:MAG: glycine--tRNA ligase subunit beta, partial [Acidobacteriota bacterium]